MIVLLHSNAVRSLNGPYDYIALFLHLITRCAVPIFAGISGYYLLFSGKQYTAKDIYFRKVPRFLGLFLLWLFIAGTYSWYIEGKCVALWEFILTNNDGFHLWYLKVYVGLLLIYPILRAITKEIVSARVYCIFWLLAISLRFTLGTIGFVVPWVANYQPLIQIPFFHYHGYIGGTIAGNYPTEYIGLFLVTGYYIKLLEKNKLGRSAKNTVIGMGIAGFVWTLVGSLYVAKRDGVFRDYFCNPIDIRMVFFALSVITIVYNVVNKESNLMFYRVSNLTLGIYLVHPLIRSFLSRHLILPAVNSLADTLLSWILTCVISAVVVSIYQWGKRRIVAVIRRRNQLQSQ